MDVNLPLVGDAVTITDVQGVTHAGVIKFVHPRGQDDGLPPWVDASISTTPRTEEQAHTIVVNSVPYKDDGPGRFGGSKPFWEAA